MQSFKAGVHESLPGAWGHYRDMYERLPVGEFKPGEVIEMFYKGLPAQYQLVLDASAGRYLLGLSANEAWDVMVKLAGTGRPEGYTAPLRAIVHEIGNVENPGINQRMTEMEERLNRKVAEGQLERTEVRVEEPQDVNHELHYVER